MKSSKEIRQLWIDYFVSKKHLFVESKSLIPDKDPSLLWINSGVATLKDYFSGKKTPPSKRLVNSQKSIRTNDIENVGVTARHHTFFEMLGNFSIGDYFKNEAIEFAHDFVVNHLKLDQKRIYITYFNEDTKVREKWASLGYTDEQLIPGSRDLNFWDVGSGPCGPNTEIFYDRGPKYHPQGPELIAQDIENDRFIEIWNVVFSEFNNMGDGTYVELSQKNIDTGAGLERIVSIMQDGPTNFDTDLFLPIIKATEKITNNKYDIDNYFVNNAKQNLVNKHFKIIADHMRAVTNAISDGEKPSNSQRGYIIRRLIRRAYYSGTRLGATDKAFLYKLVPVVVDSLIFDVDIEKVASIIKKEELVFSTTIDQGKKILDEQIAKTTDKNFDVNVAFKLYETFGFPIEMTHDILLENDLNLDFEKLSQLKENHSEVSKSKVANNNFDKAINSLNLIKENVTEFIGYDHLQLENVTIKYILDAEKEVETSSKDKIHYLIFAKTPFYATSGGQLHDQGYLEQNTNKIEILEVFKDKHGNHVHVVKGEINKKDKLSAFVDSQIRLGLMRNHSATHLTFAALRSVYGKEIDQLGSDNNQNRLTFDFPLDRKPTTEEIDRVEKFVKDVIQKNIQRNYLIKSIKEAQEMGAILTKDESDYADANKVRIVEFPTVTSDLCGGTHIDFTKNLETFKITNVESKGTGIYRIRAITSTKIVNAFLEEEIKKFADILQASFKKYKTLLESKNTKLQLINIDLDKNLDLESQLDLIKNLIQAIADDTKKLLKEPNIIQQNISYDSLKINDYNILLATDIDKNSIKDLTIQKREENPESIIVSVGQYENGKAAIIISSKTVDVQEFIASNMKSKFEINGGGNKLIWQGATLSKIDKDSLK